MLRAEGRICKGPGVRGSKIPPTGERIVWLEQRWKDEARVWEKPDVQGPYLR